VHLLSPGQSGRLLEKFNRWLSMHGLVGAWIAIDDDPVLFCDDASCCTSR
jgi:hypothetical protein